ncbi:MAG: SIMPL domain-containing protein [Candidatus Latescibacterota bacterium]|nr:SIMPL domain-containing protein [Candidatus Latescibacterota bacterium]
MKILPGLGLGLLLLAFPAAAKDVLQGRHITVSGAGSARARPDLAIAELGVTAHGETATLAMSQNRQLVASLRQALRQNGVEDADVLTSDFAIHRERGSQSQRGVDRPGERFVVRNLLQVTIRDIERAGVLLDRLVEAGANEVRGIRFTLQDDTQMALQARALAAADARQKAQHLAELHDTRLGKVLRISKSSVRGGRPQAMMMKAMDTSSSTVSVGELTFAAQLQVIYELTD